MCSGASVLTGAQICVATCSEIDRVPVSDSTTTSSTTTVQRCVTVETAAALRGSGRSRDDKVALYIVVCAAVGCALVAVIVYIVCMQRRSDTAVLNEVSTSPNPAHNGVYRDTLGFALPPPGVAQPMRRPPATPNPTYQAVDPRMHPMDDTALFTTPGPSVATSSL